MNIKLSPTFMVMDLQEVKQIKETTNDMDCMNVCNMYIFLCSEIAKGVVEDKTVPDNIKERIERLQ